jgi:hypothetical protein
MTTDLADIAAASDLAWEAVALLDTDPAAAYALAADFEGADRAVFAQGVADMLAAHARAFEYARKPARPVIGRSTPPTGTNDYEGAILAADERRAFANGGY